MIGNTVIYSRTNSYDFKTEERKGLVVDAWTNVSGSIKGEGMYKIQFTIGDKKFFDEVPSWRIKEIVSFAKMVQLDEKVIIQ